MRALFTVIVLQLLIASPIAHAESIEVQGPEVVLTELPVEFTLVNLGGEPITRKGLLTYCE